MSVRPIRLVPDPVLRRTADEIVEFDRELRILVNDLWQTMRAEGGVGLSAPQLGVPVRVATYHCDGYAGHVINPEIVPGGSRARYAEEGCLSVPGLRMSCPRHVSVAAHGWNMHGEPVTVSGSEVLSQCLQHEADHLDGVLFVDRLDGADRTVALDRIRRSPWFTDRAPADGGGRAGDGVG